MKNKLVLSILIILLFISTWRAEAWFWYWAKGLLEYGNCKLLAEDHFIVENIDHLSLYNCYYLSGRYDSNEVFMIDLDQTTLRSKFWIMNINYKNQFKEIKKFRNKYVNVVAWGDGIHKIDWFKWSWKDNYNAVYSISNFSGDAEIKLLWEWYWICTKDKYIWYRMMRVRDTSKELREKVYWFLKKFDEEKTKELGVDQRYKLYQQILKKVDLTHKKSISEMYDDVFSIIKYDLGNKFLWLKYDKCLLYVWKMKSGFVKEETKSVKLETSKSSARVGERIYFHAVNSVWKISKYNWNFGNGRSSVFASEYLYYDVPWKYNVKLTIKFTDGSELTDTISITILPKE